MLDKRNNKINLMISQKIHHVVFQAMKIASAIHSLNCRHSSIFLQNLVGDFSLQMIHQKVEFAPGNLFVIRTTNVVAVRLSMLFTINDSTTYDFQMFSAISTYLLLLVQIYFY